MELIPFERVDQVVMTTHTRAGLSRLALGSVAIGLVRRLGQPVILIRPTDTEQDLPLEEIMRQPERWKAGPQRRVLVTLDGSVEAEAVLEPAVKLAHRLQATLYLLRVITVYTPADYALPNSYYAGYKVPEMEKENQQRREEAYRYLDEVQVRLKEPELDIIKGVRIGEPANEIVTYARQNQADLLVMATHARGRLGHTLLGSVAEEVLRVSHIPVMVLHSAQSVTTLRETGKALVS